MHPFPLKLISVPLLLCALPAVHALSLEQTLADVRSTVEQGKASHVIDVDNDSLLLKRDDRFYTGGMRYAYQYTKSDAMQSTTYGWRIGQDMYTASSTALLPSQIGPFDHPYAAWLYGGVYKDIHQADGAHWSLGLDLGCLGPCAGGEWIQTNWHRLLRQKLPQGWSTQVRNEAGAVLYGDVGWKRWSFAPWLDLAPSLQGRFGNIHTDASGVALLRFGRLNALPGQETLHGFLRAELRAVAYDASLQGGYFSNDNPHVVEPKRAVGEAELGMAWTSAPFGASFSVVRRGNEIRDLPNAEGAQSFARIRLTYTP